MSREPKPGGGRPLAIAAIVVAITIWGSTFVVTEDALREAGPFAIAALRFSLGLLVLLPFAHRSGFRMGLAIEPTFLLFDLAGVALYYGLQNLRSSSPPPPTPRSSRPASPRPWPRWRFSSSGRGSRRSG